MLLFLLAACGPKAPPSATAPAEHPLLLWRVERAGHASYLLGTCHMGVDLDYALPAPHDAALTQAKIVYTEADLDLGNPVDVVRLVWSDGPGLSEKLAPEDWRAVATLVRGAIPASMLDHMEPWVVASMLPFVTAPGGPKAAAKTEAMDAAIQKRAKARGIEVRHVETLEEQAAMLRQWNDTFLAHLGPRAPDTSDEAQAVSDLCYRGDTRGADAVTQPDDPVSDALLRARNRAWVPKLLPALDAGGAFVAVGAGHMLGHDGLLDLLEGQGFTVTQLTTTRPPSDAQLPNLGGGIPAAPPAPADLAAWEERLSAPFATALCADGQVIRTCFEPDAARCVERLTVDTKVCIRQNADLLPADGAAPSQKLQSSLATCVPAGMLLDAVAHDRVGDGPMCGMLTAALKGGGK